MKKRLFIAIDLPPKIKEKIIQYQNVIKDKISEASWVRPEYMHLTLVFLGETDYTWIPEIITALEKLKDDAFEVVLSDINGFPNLSEPHTLWIGIRENLDLFYLQKKIVDRLKELNLRIDKKKFIPHLTIARIKKTKNLKVTLAISGKNDFGKFRAKEFTLFESKLLSESPKHTPIKSFRLY